MVTFSRNFLQHKKHSARQCSTHLLKNVILLLAVFASAVVWHRKDYRLLTTAPPQHSPEDRIDASMKTTSSTTTMMNNASAPPGGRKDRNDGAKVSLSLASPQTAIDDHSFVFTSKSCATKTESTTTRETDQTFSSTASRPGVITKTIRIAEQNSFVLHLYENNDIVSNSILNSGTWEMDKVNMFHKLFIDYSNKYKIPLSDLTFVDIGANIGWFTFCLAAIGVNVIAFEPMEDNIELIRESMCLQENLKSGISDRITLHAHGLGIRNETCIIYSHDINVGDGHVKCIGANEKNHDLEIPLDYTIKGRIPVFRLDDVLKNNVDGKHIVVLKMDTEGYEGNVLQGGEQLFLQEGGIDVIVTEFVPEWIRKKGNITTPEMFMQKFYEAGYLSTNKDGIGYMSPKEMLDMSNYALGRDVTLHSLTFRNSHNNSSGKA